MEKARQEKGKHTSEKPKSLVWDCGSSLYDSFELKSLERQLDSAILSSRTLSMPHLSDHRRPHKPPPPPPQPLPTQHVSKKSLSKFSKSFQKLLRSIFGPKQSSSRGTSLFKGRGGTEEGFYNFWDRSGALSTIPEVAESGGDHGGFSPDFKSLARRSNSDRFPPPTCVGISCA